MTATKKPSLKEIMLARHPKEVTRDKFIIEMNMPNEYPPIKARRTEDGGVRDRFFASVSELPKEVTVIHPFNVDAFAPSNERTFYVSPEGCDSADGTKAAPLKTPAEALSRLSGKKGGKIVLRGGNYDLDETLLITAEHAGTVESPLIITAEEGETPVLSTSHSIPYSAFAPLTDEAALARLSPELRGKVFVCDLTSLGITEFGEPGCGKSALLINNREMDLARYPNAGEDMIQVTDRIPCAGWSYETGTEIGDWEIGIDDERIYNWKWEDDICIFGALCYEWDRFLRTVKEINTEKRTIKGYGKFDRHPVSDLPNNTFFFLNVFEELDAPGEWYLDRKSGKLYVYPPEDADFADADVRFVTSEKVVIYCKETENVIIDRIDAGRCINTALKADDCRQVLFQRCHIGGTVGTMHTWRFAVDINGGYRNGIIDSLLEHFSNRGMNVGGGDRVNMIPCNNFIQNCKLINPHCRFGINSGGMANIVSHNYIHNTTYADGGHNEGIIEYNIGEGGDTETHDTGMIYVAGGGCSTCANHYRYNYFFNFEMGDYGIYFDDLSRGMYAYGNIVVGNGTFKDDHTMWEGGGRSFNHHNGCEHCYWNNISIDAGYFAFGGDISYWNDDRMWTLSEGVLDTCRRMGKEKYFGRYPTYRDYCEAYEEYFRLKAEEGYEKYSSAAEKRIRSPFGNHYENNLILRSNRPYKLDNGIESATGLETNYITNDDMGFIDEANGDFRLREDAEVFKKIPGFIAPPFERMGIVEE